MKTINECSRYCQIPVFNEMEVLPAPSVRNMSSHIKYIFVARLTC